MWWVSVWFWYDGGPIYIKRNTMCMNTTHAWKTGHVLALASWRVSRKRFKMILDRQVLLTSVCSKSSCPGVQSVVGKSAMHYLPSKVTVMSGRMHPSYGWRMDGGLPEPISHLWTHVHELNTNSTQGQGQRKEKTMRSMNSEGWREGWREGAMTPLQKWIVLGWRAKGAAS